MRRFHFVSGFKRSKPEIIENIVFDCDCETSNSSSSA